MSRVLDYRADVYVSGLLGGEEGGARHPQWTTVYRLLSWLSEQL